MAHWARTNGLIRTLYIVGGCVLLAIVITAVLQATGRIHLFNKSGSPVVATQKGETSPPSKQSQNNDNQQPSSAKADTGNDTNTKLMAPIGNFVSTHHPNLSNNPPGSSFLTSVCTTNPGATCQIIFTSGSVTRQLPAETTDAGGSAYWNNWKLQDYNITEGTWTIQAKATLGSQVEISNDALSLEVSP